VLHALVGLWVLVFHQALPLLFDPHPIPGGDLTAAGRGARDPDVPACTLHLLGSGFYL
jgi:hypothetical protein